MIPLHHDSITIDTNVFSHLTDNKKNADKHMHALLKYFISKKTYLLVDEDKKITTEYNYHLNTPKFKEIYEKREEGFIISYFMHPDVQKQVPVAEDTLWQAINKVICEEKEENDRIFVYVAFESKRILISNDKTHIVNRRDHLKEETSTMCSSEADVMTSCEAHSRI